MVSSNQIVIDTIRYRTYCNHYEKKPGVLPSLSLASQTLYWLDPPVGKTWSLCPK